MRLNTTPRVGVNDPALQRELREHATQVNLLSEGRIAASYQADTAAPAAGTWAQGDFVRNSQPSGASPVFGWICTAGGTPGTWVAVVGGSGGGGGGVSSVALAAPTGLSVSGSPVTTSGTLTLSYTAGYSIPTDASQSNWNTAFGWGNHATAGYLTSATAATTYQPLDAELTSWAGVTRAAGFDTFAATPSSANLAALVTGETGSGALVFATSPALTTPNIGAATGTSLAVTGAITSSGGGVGYATGAGGTVTQATNKATGVTLNDLCGEITMNAAALAAATIVSFTLTNSFIAAGDVLILNHVTTGTRGAYSLNAQCGAGSAIIYVRNNTAGSLSEAIVIRFAVIKAVTA